MSTNHSQAIANLQSAERERMTAERINPALEAKRFEAVQAIKRDVAALIDNREAVGSRAMLLLRSVVHGITSGGVVAFAHKVDPMSDAFKQWTKDNLSAVLPVVESEGGSAMNHPRIAATNAVKQTVRRCFVIAAWLHSVKITSIQLIGSPASRVRLPITAFAGLEKEKRARFIIEGDDQTLPLTFEGVDRACAAVLSREGLRAEAAVTVLTKATTIAKTLWSPTKGSDGSFAVTPVSPKLAKAAADLLATLIAAHDRKKNAPKKRKASKAKIIKMKQRKASKAKVIKMKRAAARIDAKNAKADENKPTTTDETKSA